MKEISITVKDRKDRTDLILKIEDYVRTRWDSRALAQGFKRGTKKEKRDYNNFRTEFMLGMVATMDCILNAEETNESSITPRLYFELMRGE
jgi:hypothetical protein